VAKIGETVSSTGSSGVAVKPPIGPMLAKLAEELPPGAGEGFGEFNPGRHY
jgi:hypothetical protein